jgi:hypothetical protein
MKTVNFFGNEQELKLPVRRFKNIPVLLVILTMFGIFFPSQLFSQTNQAPVQTVCIGTEPYLVTATPGSLFNWSVTPGVSGSEWQIHGTGNSITVDWNEAGTYTLSVFETNSYGCIGNPVAVTVTVVPVPDVNAPAGLNVMNGAASGAINFSGSQAGTVFTWTNDTPAIGLAAGGTGNIASFTAVNMGSAPVIATITVTPSYTTAGVTCTGTARSFTITVNPSTSINPVGDEVYCNNTASTVIQFSSPVGGTTFNWSNSDTSIGLGASGTGNIPVFTAVNSGSAPVVSTITVTPYLNGIAGNPISFTITVNPQPSTSPIYHN